METLKNLLALLILVSVMGSALTYAKQTEVRREIERLTSSDPVERAAAWALSNKAGKNFGKHFLEWQEWWKNNKETYFEAK